MTPVGARVRHRVRGEGKRRVNVRLVIVSGSFSRRLDPSATGRNRVAAAMGQSVSWASGSLSRLVAGGVENVRFRTGLEESTL